MRASNKNQSVIASKIQQSFPSAVKLSTQHIQDSNNINNQQDYISHKVEEKEHSCFMAPFVFLQDFYQVYRFGDYMDKILMLLGVILALCSGVTFPLFMYFWGKEIDHTINDIAVLSDTMDTSLKNYIAFLSLGVASFLIDGIVFALWKMLSERIAYQFRIKYMESFIGRGMKWVEQQNLFQTSSKFKNACLTIQKATGDKVALFYNLIGIALSGIVAAVCVRWTFALFLFALLPLGMVVLGYFIYVLIMRKVDTKKFFEKAEGQAVEATTLIKTVKILRGEAFQQRIYDERLNEYQQKIRPYSLKLGVSTGLFYFIQYFILGVGFMFGVQCVRGTSACPIETTGSRYSIGDMHIVFFQICACSNYFLQIASNYDAIKDAIQSSKEIFQFIKQSLEEFEESEQRNTVKTAPESIEEIQFKNVVFAYPTNPNRKILRKLSMKPLKNKFNAIVGATGSGKSTITQLLLKFYAPNEGVILVGGKDIAEVEADKLRQRVGYVGQEPTLFSGTIRENITVGKADANDYQIWEALHKVNMHEFVMRQPQKLEYDVGFGGQKLSGGQKQRIAIARALIKKPSVLILDEATSALDRKSEKLVQKTFEQLFTSKDLSMTVLCIAHRVRTIVKADRIFYLQSGIVREQGTFKEISYFKDVELPAEEQQKENALEEAEIRLTSKISSRYVRQNNAAQVQAQQQQYRGNIYSKLLEYTEHKGWYALSIAMSVLNGLNHPGAMLLVTYMYSQEVYMIAFGNLWRWCSSSFPQGCWDYLDAYHTNAVKYLGGLIGFAFYSFVPYFVQFYFLNQIEEEITHKLRKEVFEKLMLMPVPWYDRPDNEGGQAAARSGSDVKDASALVSTYIPILISNFTTTVAGVALCLAYFWQIGLLSLFSIPLIAVGGYISMLFVSGYDDETAPKYERSDKIANEIIVCIKTVLSLNYQKRILSKYISLMDNNPVQSLKRGAKIGFFFGLSIFVIMAAIGSAMYANVNIIATLSSANLIDVLVALTVPMWCGWVAGNSFFFASHAGAGKESARRIFKLLEEKTEAETQAKAGKAVRPLPAEIRGRIELKNVSFKYGTGANTVYVLRNVSLVIEGGQKAAFVGESGCGKSTLMLLLQRFYDFEGEITLDGVNIFEYDLAAYRSYFAVLNQQPSLFTGTIRESVLFGSEATEQELTHACKMTFAYDVSRAWKGDCSVEESINQFLSRDAGIKGSKVSGGEKQRIACARAVLKKPRIFLMDEGTSALDRETERRVQDNIDQNIRGITSVSIAHRLETIQNSGVIYMIEDGKVVESGLYGQMMERKAYFYNFVQGEKFKTVNQIAERMLRRLIIRLFGIQKRKSQVDLRD